MGGSLLSLFTDTPRAKKEFRVIITGREIGLNFWATRHKHRNDHENSPRESCGPLDRTVLTGISVRTFS